MAALLFNKSRSDRVDQMIFCFAFSVVYFVVVVVVVL